jgi:hypothetical protein
MISFHDQFQRRTRLAKSTLFGGQDGNRVTPHGWMDPPWTFGSGLSRLPSVDSGWSGASPSPENLQICEEDSLHVQGFDVPLGKTRSVGICFCRRHPVDRVTGVFGGFGVSREDPPSPNLVSSERI